MDDDPEHPLPSLPPTVPTLDMDRATSSRRTPDTTTVPSLCERHPGPRELTGRDPGRPGDGVDVLCLRINTRQGGLTVEVVHGYLWGQGPRPCDQRLRVVIERTFGFSGKSGFIGETPEGAR